MARVGDDSWLVVLSRVSGLNHGLQGGRASFAWASLLRMARRDAERAWGLARPVLLSLLVLDCGRRLLLREVEASELAGRLVLVSSKADGARGGWKEERRLDVLEAVEF